MIVANRMKRNPVFVDEGDSMKKAMDLLKEHEIRHLPVLKDGERLVGILSERDIKQASPSPATALEIREIYYLLDKIKVKQIMTRRPYTVSSSTPIEEAALIIREKKIGCLPVVDDGKLVGILTETDIIDSVHRGDGGQRPRVPDRARAAEHARDALRSPETPEGFRREHRVAGHRAARRSGRKVFILRIEAKNYKVVKAAIKKSGFDLLSAD